MDQQYRYVCRFILVMEQANMALLTFHLQITSKLRYGVRYRLVRKTA